MKLEIQITGGEPTDAELQAYIERGRESNPCRELIGIKIAFDVDFADIEYTYSPIPNEQRVCIGGMLAKFRSFNSAKQAEYLERTFNDL
ncbi:MAG: hypothetical protein IK990_02730 [Ruminiclostridium sp.]|nr:hypothetical protein [Ruminiclostridium sp.]